MSSSYLFSKEMIIHTIKLGIMVTYLCETKTYGTYGRTLYDTRKLIGYDTIIYIVLLKAHCSYYGFIIQSKIVRKLLQYIG